MITRLLILEVYNVYTEVPSQRTLRLWRRGVTISQTMERNFRPQRRRVPSTDFEHKDQRCHGVESPQNGHHHRWPYSAESGALLSPNKLRCVAISAQQCWATVRNPQTTRPQMACCALWQGVKGLGAEQFLRYRRKNELFLPGCRFAVIGLLFINLKVWKDF